MNVCQASVSLGFCAQMLIRWGVPLMKRVRSCPKTFQSLEKKLYDKILYEKNDDEDDLGYFSLDLTF